MEMLLYTAVLATLSALSLSPHPRSLEDRQQRHFQTTGQAPPQSVRGRPPWLLPIWLVPRPPQNRCPPDYEGVNQHTTMVGRPSATSALGLAHSPAIPFCVTSIHVYSPLLDTALKYSSINYIVSCRCGLYYYTLYYLSIIKQEESWQL